MDETQRTGLMAFWCVMAIAFAAGIFFLPGIFFIVPASFGAAYLAYAADAARQKSSVIRFLVATAVYGILACVLVLGLGASHGGPDPSGLLGLLACSIVLVVFSLFAGVFALYSLRQATMTFRESGVPQAIAEGGCFCGAIRYRVGGNATNSMICHCRTCRKVAGSPVVAWVTFPVAHFQVIAGEPSAFFSSPTIRRTYCGDCGTPLTYALAAEPVWVDVTTCSLDAAGAFPPTHHSWLEHDLAWVRFGDGLPAFQQSRNGGGA